jgi:hypothetical protein
MAAVARGDRLLFDSAAPPAASLESSDALQMSHSGGSTRAGSIIATGTRLPLPRMRRLRFCGSVIDLLPLAALAELPRLQRKRSEAAAAEAAEAGGPGPGSPWIQFGTRP